MSLKPWREVVSPHPDVAKGRYQQAEFAADLAQVLRGDAAAEYGDPTEFFDRTYLTEGMTRLLTTVVERVAGKGGEPVVQLKTAFGGGKTHTMLALYHMLGGKADPEKLPGVANILKAAAVAKLPKTEIAVVVGTALNPSKPWKSKKTGEIPIQTLWGEIAAQLGGVPGYERVRTADESGVAPGSYELTELFDAVGPCVVLIDELVAYARNIFGVSGLSAGSFGANMTFIHSLTEAARNSKASLVVAAIPESKIEIGGSEGKAALEQIENTFARLEAVWKPVGPTEGFEIVRRRLFGTIRDEAARDFTCGDFFQMYREGNGDFPQECREGTYLERLRGAYPIHPEIFDRLYEDWSTMETFQRTRGVLRLMAAVIHELWVRDDRSLLILPGNIPIDAPRVKNELTRYLPEGWDAVIDKDIDGDQSEPRKIDESNQRFGTLLAARKMARAIFLGSAPSVRAQRVRGIEDIRARLGVVQPGESVAVFNDALGKMQDRLTYLYAGNRRYWFDTVPNLIRTVDDRAGRWDPAEVEVEIVRRLCLVQGRADFKGVHICSGSADIPDEQEARLVVLPPGKGHRAGRTDSPAMIEAKEILEKRGTVPRQYRNMLIFVPPDKDSMETLEYETRRYLAWKSVIADAKALNLDEHQKDQATESVSRSDRTVNVRLQEAYGWLLAPVQEGTEPMTWDVTRIAGGTESYVVKAAKKLQTNQQLITRWSPALLRMELDKWLWKDTSHIGVKKLWEYLCTYIYLPRLRDVDVLLDAIRDGVRSRDFFGYAAAVGEDGRYQGLVFGTSGGSILLDSYSVLVKPEVAMKQQESEVTATEYTSSKPAIGVPTNEAVQPYLPEIDQERIFRRFHGSVYLDPMRLGRDAGKVAEEVVQHMAGILGAKVEVTLEIHAEIPSGAPEHVVRTVTENCSTLKFKTYGFEEE